MRQGLSPSRGCLCLSRVPLPHSRLWMGQVSLVPGEAKGPARLLLRLVTGRPSLVKATSLTHALT
jgi:hypothetical protein